MWYKQIIDKMYFPQLTNWISRPWKYYKLCKLKRSLKLEIVPTVDIFGICSYDKNIPNSFSSVDTFCLLHTISVTVYIPRHTYWFYSATFVSRERLYEVMCKLSKLWSVQFLSQKVKFYALRFDYFQIPFDIFREFGEIFRMLQPLSYTNYCHNN